MSSAGGAVIRLVVPGPVPRKNRRHGMARGKGGKPRAFLAKSYVEWCKLLGAATAPHGKIEAGEWDCSIRIYHGKWRHIDVKTPHIDVDAPISSVLDGLQRVGLLDDDVRIISLKAAKFYAKSPRIEIDLDRRAA
jgi:Holliday junction resolvase RusA-like endonuclease